MAYSLLVDWNAVNCYNSGVAMLATSDAMIATCKEVPMPSSVPSTRFYVYVLARPDGSPFYVGKGSGSRIYHHEREARRGVQSYKCHIIRKIWRSGGEVQRYIVLATDDEQEALAYECDLIALYGRHTLANATNGGESITGVDVGWGNPVIRARRIAGNNTPERKRSRSATAKALWADPQHRQQRAARIQAKLGTPEYKAKRAEQTRQQWADPEFKTKTSAALRARYAADPDLRQRNAEKNREVGNRPEIRARRREYMKARYDDPAEREKTAAQAKAAWARRKAAKEG